MPAPVVEVVFVVLVAALGAATGWCLRGGSARRSSSNSNNETRNAREVLARLHELAAHVAADVGEHSNRVEEISEELLSSPTGEAETVVSAVDRLLQANNRMQEQLASADERLREQARQIESTAVEARTDALTGLANRRAFDDETARRLAEFRRHGRPFSVIMIDVDHFKRFNDTHGHQAGDTVLAGLGGVLRGAAREMDVAARYGGEEFAVVLPGTSGGDAAAAAERIRHAVETTPFRFQTADLHVTVSMGVAEFRAEEDVAGLLRRADEALYASKQSGRNRASFHDGQTIQPIGRSEPAAPCGRPQDVFWRAEQPLRQPEGAPAELPHGASAGAPANVEVPDGDARCDRAAFDESLRDRFEQWRRGGPPPAVLFVRIDRFEQIARDHGKQVRDLALGASERLIDAAIRDAELLAHYGNGTFAVLLRGANLGTTVATTERLREAVEECRLPTQDGQLQFTVSVSAAAASDDDDASKLLRRAEEALDAALSSGGDCSYFHNGQWSEMVQATLQTTG